MLDLIESLQIFSKYFDATDYTPTHCEHDIMILCVANDKDIVSAEDAVRLNKLGWHWSDEYDCWCSNRFGSC